MFLCVKSEFKWIPLQFIIEANFTKAKFGNDTLQTINKH